MAIPPPPPTRTILAARLLVLYLRESRESLPEEHVRQIVGDVSESMAFLHGQTTVHGDLKSANILFEDSRETKMPHYCFSTFVFCAVVCVCGSVTFLVSVFVIYLLHARRIMLRHIFESFRCIR